MTFSSASVSACDVEAVAAIAAGTIGLRLGGGGNAACWRVAGCMAGAASVAAGATFLTAGGVGEEANVFGTTLRAIGRGLGSGTFAAASASTAPNNPTLSARDMPKAVRCEAVRCTALLCGADPGAKRVTAFLQIGRA